MKKIIALVLALVMVFALCACGQKESGEAVVKIGVFEPQSGDNGAGGKQEVLGIEYANTVVPSVTIDGVEYDIELVYYATPDTEAEVIANVEGSDGAIVRYNEWQTAALGRDVNPDQLRRLILSPAWAENLSGAIRVDMVKPEHMAVTDTEVAKFSGNLTVSHQRVTGVV